MSKPLCMIAALIIGASLSWVGCGSGGATDGKSTSTTAFPGRGIVTDVVPAGPKDPAANLTHLLAESAPDLRGASVSCPEVDDPPEYPFSCEFTADQGKGRVGGIVSVHGVYAPTMTYVYETSYRPLRAR